MTLSLRTLSISLALSLALNMFLLGINAGPLFLHPHGPLFGPKDGGPHMMNDRPPGGRPSPERMIEDLAKNLPDSDRAKLMEEFNKKSDTLSKIAPNNMQENMKAVAGALRQQPFSADDLEKALNNIRTHDNLLHETISGIILNSAPQLSQNGRDKLAESLEKGPPNRHTPPRPGDDHPCRDLDEAPPPDEKQ